MPPAGAPLLHLGRELDVGGGAIGLGAFLVEDGEEFVDGGRLAAFVVDDDVVELGGGGHFFAGGGEPDLEVGFGVGGASAEAPFKSGEVRHGDEDEQGLRDAFA